ncbi:carbon storage regulator [Paludisphaera mucosa]|uniref:Carbon storage regulator n=1 Tax=Paludisphaera mucosa TaxID=3030827 RepID=A0ABT6F6Q4_9BACT|nr:carbon storage regulator [Paludisphaera mucosa]MDG3003261.1 carbon storage regulator [Paludisphaera mucosa]
MLVLSRKPKESVWLDLGDGRFVKVEFCLLREGRVRLGFHAPATVQILREELLAPDERKRREELVS